VFGYNAHPTNAANYYGKDTFPFVDIRNDGGFVVVAPSNHKSGGTYSWDNWSDAPLVHLPKHLVDKRKKKKEKDAEAAAENPRSLEDVAAMLKYISADDRDTWRKVGIILGRTFGASEEAWKMYCEWSDTWKGQKARNHDEIMKQAFYETSQEDPGDKPLTMGTLVVLAQEGGWEDGGSLPELSDIFTKHAMVAIKGERYILTETTDEKGNPVMTLSNRAAMSLQYANRWVTLGEKRVNAFDLWLRSRKRRDYAGVVFDPSARAPKEYYNLFKGFAVEARAGDCALYLSHVRDVICSGNTAHYEWVEAWLAHAVQRPAELPGTAIVMRGDEGLGKGKFAYWFGKLFGEHYLQVTSQRHLTGNFNAHMENKLVIFADEAYWAGSKEARGALYGMITEEARIIEHKGVNSYTINNYARLLMASNGEWIVPAGPQARRFLVLDISAIHREDFPYFKAIDQQMQSGGLEALLAHLLAVDIGRVNLRHAPRTKALLDQKVANMDGVERFWLDILRRGSVQIEGAEWQEVVPKDAVYTAWMEGPGRGAEHNRKMETELGQRLQKFVPNIRETRPTVGTRRARCHVFPPLKECRSLMAEHLQCDPAELFGKGWDQPPKDDPATYAGKGF